VIQIESILTNKRIVLGVTGSIAAYKAATLASHMTQMGAQIDVIMTAAAQKFVTPLTFQALTGRPVYTDMWQADSSGALPTHIAHVGLAHGADLLLVAPITANSIAKMALGLADNLLSITALAARCPILICPAMDAGMYESPVVQGHIRTLAGRGFHVYGPLPGRMASGLEGLGRFPEPDDIIGEARRVLGLNGPLKNRRIVVSAGPTCESLDPVRYLTNHSSGKQGFAIAEAAVEMGAQVTVIAGPVNLPTPPGATRIDVQDTRSMLAAVLEHTIRDNQADALIMAAAVADFRPADYSNHKIKKEPGKTDAPSISLTVNPDILAEVAQQAVRPKLTIGFAAESHDLIENAQGKLERKKLDLIIANDITASDAGFSVDTNRVLFITPQGIEDLPLMSKQAVARRVMGWVAEKLGS
jgi:phosphopantothenoylcysteine decarboxylase/phosphopantothenate--cysteine ligase